jgi:CBS-domain-containing membrane protein
MPSPSLALSGILGKHMSMNSAQEMMSPTKIRLTLDTSFREALRVFDESKHSSMLVFDSNFRLKGALRKSDFVKGLIQHRGQSFANVTLRSLKDLLEVVPLVYPDQAYTKVIQKLLTSPASVVAVGDTDEDVVGSITDVEVLTRIAIRDH